MSDITHYFMAHAHAAVRKTRGMKRGTPIRNRQRVVARVYHRLAKESAHASNVQHLNDFRKAQRPERTTLELR